MKEGRLSPDAIDPFLCTHIIYAFAILNTNNTIVPNDPYLDTTHGVGKFFIHFITFIGLLQFSKKTSYNNAYYTVMKVDIQK